MRFEDNSNDSRAIDPAAACRQLASGAAFGALATVAREPAGHPFATLVAVAFDARGRPLLLLSRLAEHCKNLVADPRASLLVTDPTAAAGDPLAASRMTLVGTCAPLAAEEEIERARSLFLARHPEAASYVTFADFGMWRLDVASVRWIAGFGRMQWVSGEAYASPSG
jgi:heme iron utilization protein